ncbi:MAG: cytochrome-c oxidase, cbb3-type subunit II, partial [Rhodospirillaceae bacterium]|nr:cytochrome-c oxidase, cbb3-type subunit II [Rhodospirillaceae bacterium]
MIASAYEDMVAQADPEGDWGGLEERYGDNVNTGDFDGDPERLTEMDALVAYLQVLGTMVNFSEYSVEDLRQ